MARAYVRPIRLDPGERLPDMHEVFFDAGDYQIPAWRGGHGSDVFLCVHGYGGTPAGWNNLARELLPFAEVVSLATKGQTISPEGEVGFGLGEAQEVLAVARILMAEGKRIHLVGVSMGGAACWIAAGTEPALFASVTTEAAFSRLDWATDEFLSVSIPHGSKLFGLIVVFAERQVGIKGIDVRPFEYAAKWNGPCTILQSQDDGMFSARHAEEIAKAVKQPVRWFKGLKHAEIIQERAGEVALLIREIGNVG